ncbi:MAG: V-type ATPase subunit [Lachnospiraceae bacterium]|nr:V-type ATPase subunit [Lachnospiraceae bacterium]
MTDKNYIYAVARVRSHEMKLLSDQTIDRLVHADSMKSALELLNGFGWNGSDPAEMLQTQEEAIWSFVDEIVDDRSVFNVLHLRNDGHNLKAAVKAAYTGEEVSGTLTLPRANIAPALVVEAVRERNFEVLPEAFRESAKEALDELFKTGDGHRSDTIIDRAVLDEIRRAGEASGDEVLSFFSEITVASSDIKIAVRGADTGAGREYFEGAVADCSSLKREELIQAGLSGREAIYSCLSSTEYAEGVPELKKSISAFERFCDNRLIRFMKPQIHHSFTLSPIAAFILGRENEIKTVRIVLSGKQNGLEEDFIRERVREMYG